MALTDSSGERPLCFTSSTGSGFALGAAVALLYGATRGISELITVPGLINVDFADVRTIMREMGDAIMGSGVSSGENRAVTAAKAAINSPLLEASIEGARGILLNISQQASRPAAAMVPIAEPAHA